MTDTRDAPSSERKLAAETAGRYWEAEPTGRVFQEMILRGAVGSARDIVFMAEIPAPGTPSERGLNKAEQAIADHNAECKEICHKKAEMGNCAYRRKDGTYIYGKHRTCHDCPADNTIDYDFAPSQSERQESK